MKPIEIYRSEIPLNHKATQYSDDVVKYSDEKVYEADVRYVREDVIIRAIENAIIQPELKKYATNILNSVIFIEELKKNNEKYNEKYGK